MFLHETGTRMELGAYGFLGRILDMSYAPSLGLSLMKMKETIALILKML